MSTFVLISGQVYINPGHIQSVRAYAEKLSKGAGGTS